MAKWVTFYWSIMNGTVDLVEHKDKETAREYFFNHYKKYFEYFDLNTDMKKNCKLPTSYGYSHRRFYAMTKREYKIFFGKFPGKKQQDKKKIKKTGRRHAKNTP